MTKETNFNSVEEVAKEILDLANNSNIFGKQINTLSIENRISIAIAALKIDNEDSIYLAITTTAFHLNEIAKELKETNKQIYFKN